jgi:hypothetical protein
MNPRRADRKLHLELLRARGAADRLELSLAVQDLSDRLAPLRRAADVIGQVGQAVASRGRPWGWVAAAGAALARQRWLGRSLARLAAGIRSASAPRARIVAIGALAAATMALIMRRARRSGRSAPADRAVLTHPDSKKGM